LVHELAFLLAVVVAKGVKTNLAENSGSIIGDRDIAVGGNKNLVEAAGTLSQPVRYHSNHRASRSIPEKS
jgi:hypothetical protein